MSQEPSPHHFAFFADQGRKLLQRIAHSSPRTRLFWGFACSLFLAVILLTSFASNILLRAFAGSNPGIARASFTFPQFLKQGNTYHAFDGLHVKPDGIPTSPFNNKSITATVKQILPSAEPAKMQSVSLPLDSSYLTAAPAGIAATNATTGASLHLIGSDAQGQRLEVVIPSGALDLSKATIVNGGAPQGALSITLAQLRGHFSAATNDLGSFQLQVKDGQNQVLQNIQLHTPVTFIYHYRTNELTNLGIDPGKLFLIWPDLLASATASKQSISGTVIPLQNNATSSTLTAQSTVLSTSPLVVSGGTNPIQAPPKPIFASVQPSSGQLVYSYPLQTAPGPLDTGPSLAVGYSSGATNARNSPTTPANFVGEGWDLSLGAVTANKYPDGTVWYSINSVDSVSDLLIPDTSGTSYATQHVSYLKIKRNTSQNCFQVYDPDGNYYEFGCTSDSLQYYVDSSGNSFNYRYDLDKFVPANEGPNTDQRMMVVSYVQDKETDLGHTWIRDAAPKQIIYGTSANRAGTVDFFYNGPTTYSDPSSHIQYVTQYSSSYENSCNLPTTSPQPQRCDDPIDRASGLPDPDVMSTLSLQTVKTYVGDNSSTTHLDNSYSFSYQDTAFGNCPSSVTSLSSAYCAGNHLLTSITPTVYQSGTGHQLPSVTFTYSGAQKNTYHDSSQSNYYMENDWNYLTGYHDRSDGVGATIVYHTAYNNSHGTPNTAGDNRYDALYCDWNPNNCNAGTAFYPMDDKMWTQQVVTQITDDGKDSSASSLSNATVSYDYWLTTTQGSCPADTASPPSSACVGFGWIPNSGQDWQDFYHGEFIGFGTSLMTNASGDLTVNYYGSTWGWDSPSSDPKNYLAGELLETDVYKGGASNGSNLFSKTSNTYAGQNSTQSSCEPTSLYPSTIYTPCEIVLLSSRTTQYELTGNGNTNAPWMQNDYIYDDYSSSVGLHDNHQAPATGAYHNLQQQVISGSNVASVTRHWTYNTTDTSVSGRIYYNVRQAAHSDMVDAGGHMWQCEDTLYDENVASGVPRPSAGWHTTTTIYRDCANQATTAIKSYTGYSLFGDVVATVDSVGAASPTLYSNAGCTLTTAPQIFPVSSWSSTHYTICKNYDTTSTLPTDTWDTLRHHTTTNYDPTQGLLVKSVVDADNATQTTSSYSYDSSGNINFQVNEPGEMHAYTHQSVSKSTCTDSSVLPCLETDSNNSLYTSAVTRTFYDSQGRTVETIGPGPDTAHSLISFTVYNDTAHSIFQSLPFRVASRTTWLDPNGATDDTGATPGGTSVLLDTLGRTISSTNALSQQTKDNYGLGTVSGDSNTYAMSTGIDANNHVQVNYVDALGRQRYLIDESGLNGGTLTPNQQKTVQYNAIDRPISVMVTDLAPQTGQTITSVTTTTQYDDLGRVISVADPDRGTHTYTYDVDDRILTDSSGSRTIGSSYDLLGRPLCIQDAAPTTDGSGNCSTGSHPLVQNTYDTSVLGIAGSTDFSVGALTKSISTTYYDPNDYSNKTMVTEQYQHDQRGSVIASTMQIGLPTTWGVTTSLPTYQQTQAYNSVNQPTTTQTTLGGTSGYTFSLAYDSTTGLLTGLSNNSTGVANMATLGYDTHGLLSDITFQTPTSTQLATEHFDVDGVLRPAATNASWQSGSGSSGTIFTLGRAYDAVGNVTSTNTGYAAISGQTNSGGSETQNFCYDEQNRLIWAGNSGTQPAAGNGTCGSGGLANSLSSGNYSNTQAYTHLGQLWQGPLNGTGSSQQYLYCDSTHPHQLTGIYPTGTSCSNLTGASYSASYDSWGNMTSRTASGTTATLSYSVLDELVAWNAGSSSQEWYAYDSSGNRVVRRSITGSGTSITTYAFGLEEHVYDASGNPTSNTYYYSLAGRLIGEATGTATLSTQFFLTDDLGSVITAFSSTAGSAVILGNQAYGPYGNLQYHQGTMGTAKGYTGQYADATGLDYYNARYYDPIAANFLSADSVEGNSQGLDPYSYVQGNPETATDPSGQRVDFGGGEQGIINFRTGTVSVYENNTNWTPSQVNTQVQGYIATGNSAYLTRLTNTRQTPVIKVAPKARIVVENFKTGTPYNPFTDSANSTAAKILQHTGITDLKQSLSNPHSSIIDKAKAVGTFVLRNVDNAMKVQMILDPVTALGLGGEKVAAEEGSSLVARACGGLSFTPDTHVATDQGEQAIGTLKAGEKVWAYNAQTQKMELQPIQHVWINHDNDLIDLTLFTPAHTDHGKPVAATTEVIHTNQKHPFLTQEAGFVPVGELLPGMHIIRSDGSLGVVSKWEVVPGTKIMYNLEVAQDHTFMVGDGQWVVHNCGATGTPNLANKVGGQPDLYTGQRYDPQDLIDQGYTQVTRGGRGGTNTKYPNTVDFFTYLRSQGKSTAGWKYTMQTWVKQGASDILNHYWTDGVGNYFHHH